MTLIAEYKEQGTKKAVEVSQVEINPYMTNFYWENPYGQKRCIKSVKTENFLGVKQLTLSLSRL